MFEPGTWAQFEKAAQTKGTTADYMIIKAVVDAVGTVVMDNYQEKRGRKPWPEA